MTTVLHSPTTLEKVIVFLFQYLKKGNLLGSSYCAEIIPEYHSSVLISAHMTAYTYIHVSSFQLKINCHVGFAEGGRTFFIFF